MLLLVKFRQEYYSSAFILVDVVHGALTFEAEASVSPE
jgi:hypothetical protein